MTEANTRRAEMTNADMHDLIRQIKHHLTEARLAESAASRIYHLRHISFFARKLSQGAGAEALKLYPAVMPLKRAAQQ